MKIMATTVSGALSFGKESLLGFSLLAHRQGINICTQSNYFSGQLSLYDSDTPRLQRLPGFDTFSFQLIKDKLRCIILLKADLRITVQMATDLYHVVEILVCFSLTPLYQCCHSNIFFCGAFPIQINIVNCCINSFSNCLLYIQNISTFLLRFCFTFFLPILPV